MSPYHHPAVGHPLSPSRRAGSAQPLSSLCLTLVLGTWEEAGSQDAGLREDLCGFEGSCPETSSSEVAAGHRMDVENRQRCHR